MKRIGRPEDDFREKLSQADIERICKSHGIEMHRKIIAERRGNETVAYHLDDTYFLSFGVSDPTRRKVEVLRIFEHLEAMPTPKVIGWSEEDPGLGVPYMILERCPGMRLDSLWHQCGPEERPKLLEALGSGMGRYHTIRLEDAEAAARRAGLEQWVVNHGELRYRRASESRLEAQRALGHLARRLQRWEMDVCLVNTPSAEPRPVATHSPA